MSVVQLLKRILIMKPDKFNYLFALLIFPITLFAFWRDLPPGISHESKEFNIDHDNIKFLRDLTYMDNDHQVYDQQIFKEVYKLIDKAEEFLVLDIFLFLETSIDTNSNYIHTTTKLTDKLIEKKNSNPDMPIYFITDEFNIFYYSHPNRHLEKMKDAGIHVIMTDMTKLRDSHQPYSLFWRLIPQWFGDPDYNGWLPNPFTEPKEKIAVRSLLKLLNFKANHRKLILSEKSAIITSANPHTASSLHSNIGFYVEGKILQDILYSEKAVAELSGTPIDIHFSAKSTTGDITVKYITEGKIRKNLLHYMDRLSPNDTLDISVFYLSDRKIIKQLEALRQRGCYLRILLDPNKDAFGKEKNGIPNRQVAHELHPNGIEIRWANTHGEQFHTKMAIFSRPDSTIIIGGSANFTKRNIGDKNLEANILIKTITGSDLSHTVKSYFHRIWNDEKYSLNFDAYRDDSFFKYWLYRYQEFTGASTY